MNVPPKGTYARDVMVLHVRIRQLGHVLFRDVPFADMVPWPEVRRVWGHRLDMLGTAYLVVAVVVLVLWLAGEVAS